MAVTPCLGRISTDLIQIACIEADEWLRRGRAVPSEVRRIRIRASWGDGEVGVIIDPQAEPPVVNR